MLDVPRPPRHPPRVRRAVPALLLSLAACQSPTELSLDITAGHESDAFTAEPAVTRVDVAVTSLDGSIDAICSDHTPVDEDAKQLPFAEAEAGATGLELLLPLALKWAKQGRLALADGLAKITLQPARILGLDAGHLSVGAAADVCVFDPDKYWKVESAALKSQGKNTPFIGMELQGRVRYTLVDGQLIYQSKACQ